MGSTDLLHTLRGAWARHQRWVLPCLILFMAVVAGLKLISEFQRLLWDTGYTGAIDVRQLHRWVGDWFSGRTRPWVYPPGAFVMLWPLVGWLSLGAVKWLWAITSLLALAITILLMFRITEAKTFMERCFVALLLLSLNGTGVTIGNGQVILHILPALIASILVLERGHGSVVEDLVAAALMTWALMKPTVSAPFFWIILFGWKRWRPAFFVAVMYLGVTLFACAFRNESVLDIIRIFIKSASEGAEESLGTRNIHALLASLGWAEYNGLASIIILVLLGTWTFWYRRADPWLLAGVAALIARMWTYHRVYDDVLIVLAELALFRVATQSASTNQRTIAGILLGLTAVAMLCPARFLQDPWRWRWAVASSHVLLWLIMLAFLMLSARASQSLKKSNLPAKP